MTTGKSIRADASFRHCDIEHSRDEQGNWYDANGRDGGGNIEQTPVFRDETHPAGTVTPIVWITADDGLRLQNTSPCIDKADGDFAPEKDIIGIRRYDEGAAGGGVGQPPYVDIGAYEYHPLQVHFCGLVISDMYSYVKEWRKAFEIDNEASNIIDVADGYPDTETAIPKAVEQTLDSIAIRDGVKLTIWSGKNFTGQVLLERVGPAVIYNVHYNNPWDPGYQRAAEAMTRQWIEPLQSEFPQRVRKWSDTDMYMLDYWWGKGSFKIE